MTVNLEIKGMLARLLATEDLIVEHKKVETACFNVHTRVLTLPMWERASDNIYSLLCAHEVGHSRETPDIDWSITRKIPSQFVNIVEDVRVEKLMKRRYAGLAKTFFNGYKELADQDFFSIGDDNVSTYNLADRVNLYFKIGNFISLDFTIEEKEIVDMIGATETFNDALDAAAVLYNYCKKEKDQKSEIDIDSDKNQTSGTGNNPASDFSDSEEGDNEQSESGGENGSSSGEQESSVEQESDYEPEVKTVESLEKSLKELVNNNGYENAYLEIPQVDPSKVIVSNLEIHNNCKNSWSSYLNANEYTESEIFGVVDKEFREFRRSAQKEVNYLVKEFECRKAADSYARASTARTGLLDCSKLHTYKYNEDLFKKVSTFADGKNHGLIFILDWSGSMANVIRDTVKQLFNLVWFCKKVNIPFEVYSFTYDYPRGRYDEFGRGTVPEPAYKKKDGVLCVGEWFSLMNMLTSKVNIKTLEEQMLNIYRIAKTFGRSEHYCRYQPPMGWSLSGTPLNETFITLHQILPQFQRENKLQKVQCVILTDGEASPLKYHKEVQRHWEDTPYMGTVGFNPSNSFLRDRKTGNTYSLNCEWYEFTDILIRNLRDKFPTVNFIGMRILESGDAGSFIRRYCGYHGPDYDQAFSSWKKEKTFSIKSSGYHTYFGLSANALSNDTEFTVSEDATKGQIKTAFVKSLKNKKMNKKVLGEFVELVA